MFEKYRLVQITKNIEGGEAQEITAKDTEKEIMNLFYDKCSSLGGNPSTAKVELLILDKSGKQKRIEQIDNTKYDTVVEEA